MMGQFFIQLSATLIFLLGVVLSSPFGQNKPEFRQCLSDCIQNSCDPVTGDSLQPLPIELRITQWSCTDNCKYECMIPMYEAMRDDPQGNGPVIQFYGKWPFYRVFGVQELFSVLFSILNGVTHYLGYHRIRREAPATFVYRSFYLGNALIALNTWLWSAVFHTRDKPITERLDYFSAYLTILYGLYFSVLRATRTPPNLGSRFFVLWTLFCIAAYAHHIIVMNIQFDYFYNMLAGVVVGVSHNLLWIGWSIVNKDHPGRWLPATCAILISLALMFEIFDFPAKFGLIDAHSLWHAATVLIIPLWYEFFVRDANFLAKTKLG